MLFKDVEVTIISVDHKQGIAKVSGKPYSFYTLTVADSDLNRIPCMIGGEILADGMVPDWLFRAAEKKLKASVDVEFTPKGFNIGVKVVAVMAL